MPAKAATRASNSRRNNPLNRYQSMRNFRVTDEPRGSKSKSRPAKIASLPFVVQKHAATRLHYDFRLGWDGVLKSWAVAKGPSYNPADKRLAVQVEDHPWEYRTFEGIIPQSQYGGGTVMVWDQGTWIPHGDVDEGLTNGHLKFELDGKKLRGDWVLVRMHGRANRSDKPNWLLIKEKDEFARDGSGAAITDEAQDSAVSGRTMQEIASNKDRVWNSSEAKRNGTTKAAEESTTRASAKLTLRKKTTNQITAALRKLPTERFPKFIPPQLAQPASKAPDGDGWIHELKLDGYRIQLHLHKTGSASRNQLPAAMLFTRKGLDWSARMPDIVAAAQQLPVTSAVLDGEAVALDERGVSSFADLQAAFQEGRQKYISYFAFDLLHLDGHNLRGLPLVERKAILEKLLSASQGTPLRLSEDIAGSGSVVFEKSCALGAEGIVSKRASSVYSSGRSDAWLKLKCGLEQEFVIGGFTLPSNGINGVGSLMLGYYEEDKLKYAGRTGTGFTQATHKILRSKLNAIEVKKSPFESVPREMQKGVHWVKPALVTQVAFSTWTRDNLVRQAAFKGLREDKPADEVTRELPGAAKGKTRANRTSSPRSNPKRGGVVNEASGLTHPGKVLDAQSGLTKRTLAEYLMAIAEHMLPHVADRPLSVVRCPDGNAKPCFFQKHVGMGTADSVKSVTIKNRKSGEKEQFLTIDSVEGLVGLAQMGVLEIHTWGSRNESIDHPDRIVFDIDPDPAIHWDKLAATALELRSRLTKLGLKSFLKGTGGKGLHIVVPVKPEHEWREIKAFAHELVLEMERENPRLYITKMSLAARKNRIFLDYLRNDREATSIAPFSPRARNGAPVSVPLDWSQLKLPNLPMFYLTEFDTWRKRLRNDPWRNLPAITQSIPTEVLKKF